MNITQFIEQIAQYVKKYAPKYGICVYSPIIAQAILESYFGTNYKATFGHNYHGLKYRPNRVPVSIGKFTDTSEEDRGDYNEKIVDEWFKFANMEDGVHGYFQFINNANYSNLKGVTDPQKYVENIKADNFATDDDYVYKIMNIIEEYNLTKYDEMEEKNMLKIAIDAGHGLYTAGKRCSSKIDPKSTREWVLNSRIADKLCNLLKSYDCEVLRVDDTTGKTDIALVNRCKNANDWGADVYISVHHNAGINGGSGGGTIVCYYSSKAERKAQTQNLYNAVVKETGLIGNRSTKVSKNAFFVLKNTNMPAFLIENGFMDSTTDVPIILTETHADKTAKGLLNFLISDFKLKANGKAETPAAPEAPKPAEKPTTATNVPYSVKITASSLNIRAGAGTNNKIVGCFTDNENLIKGNPKFYYPKGVYTIVEVKDGWGKLKSGIGWISLNYTKRV